MVFIMAGTMASSLSNAADEYGSNLDAFSKEKAKEQLLYLMSKSVDRAQARVESDIVFKPYAAVFKPNGEIKYVELGEDRFDDSVATEIIRRSLRKLAEVQKIATSAVYYTIEAESDDGVNNRVLVVELEHAMGVSFISATPYKRVDGKLLFGESVERKHTPQVMYVEKSTENEEESEINKE